jgi:hypothetical protein
VPKLQVAELTVTGYNSGPYGNFTTIGIMVDGKTGQGTFLTSLTKALDTVAINDVTFDWKIDSVAAWFPRKDGKTFEKHFLPLIGPGKNLGSSTNRIYTLFAKPLAPMATPWATVLELAAGLAKGKSNATDLITAVTRGIHRSLWTTFQNAHFVNPRAVMGYNTNFLRTSIGRGNNATSFATQVFDLANFMAFLPTQNVLQQCEDNSNLSVIFLRSLGIAMQDMWIGVRWPVRNITDLLNPATFYPAGRLVRQAVNVRFQCHQFGYYQGKVYDPNIRKTANGDPPIGLTLRAYMNLVFPGQGNNYQRVLVRTLTIGNVNVSPVRP